MDKTTKIRVSRASKSLAEAEKQRDREQEFDGPDALSAQLRLRIGELIEDLVAAELEQALEAGRYERRGESRGGYRHTWRQRELTTSMGPTTIHLQRGRLFDAQGRPSLEWQSRLLPRYSRRAREVDDSILAAYLSGANSRRVRTLLKPLLKTAHLSKSAVSRVVSRLKKSFEQWRTERLDGKAIAYLFLDAINVKVRTDRRVQTMPILVAMGVDATGQKELLGLLLMNSESTAAWSLMVQDLVARGLCEPILCIIDGNAGLKRAVEQTWPRAQIQRCTVHKLRNLEAHCPKRSLNDLRADYHAIVQAETESLARKAYARFIKLWQMRSEAVARSLQEGGEDLLTYFRFPSSQWKSLCTTNAIERLNEEFRRRIKTQACMPSESSALYLFFGLYQSGQIRFHRIRGWQDLPQLWSQTPLEPATTY